MKPLKNKYYDRLVDLTAALTKQQRKIARELLANFKSPYNSQQDTKSLDLFNDLVQRKGHVPSFAFVKKKYKTGAMRSEASFNKFLDRLYEKILDSWTLSFNTDNPSEWGEKSMARFDVSKKMQQARMLQSKRLTEQAHRRLKSVIRKAKKYELLSTLGEALSEYHDFAVVMNLQKEADQAAFDLTQQAKDWHYYSTLRMYFMQTQQRIVKSSLNKGDWELFVTATQFSAEAIKSTTCATVHFYHYLLWIEFHRFTEEFGDRLENCEGLLELVRSSTALNDKYNLTLALAKKADSLVDLFRFEEALACFREAGQITKKGHPNRIIFAFREAEALMLCGDWEACQVICTRLLLQIGTRNPSHLVHKIQYLKATCHLLAGDAKQAHRLFEQAFVGLSSDRAGWNIGGRIMMILCSLEQERFEFAASQIKNLRKYAYELTSKAKPGDDTIRERDRLMISILDSLARNSFDYAKTLELKNADMALLESAKEGYRWEPYTHELVSYHGYLSSRLDAQVYRFQLSKPVLQWANRQQPKKATTPPQTSGSG